MIQAVSSFNANFSENSCFLSANTFEKEILCKDYCIAHHDDKLLFLPNFRYQLILIGDAYELTQKLNAFCFTYQQVEYPYTLFKYRFAGKIVVKSGQVFDIVQTAVCFNQRNREVDKVPSIAIMRLVQKNARNIHRVLH